MYGNPRIREAALNLGLNIDDMIIGSRRSQLLRSWELLSREQRCPVSVLLLYLFFSMLCVHDSKPSQFSFKWYFLAKGLTHTYTCSSVGSYSFFSGCKFSFIILSLTSVVHEKRSMTKAICNKFTFILLSNIWRHYLHHFPE